MLVYRCEKVRKLGRYDSENCLKQCERERERERLNIAGYNLPKMEGKQNINAFVRK